MDKLKLITKTTSNCQVNIHYYTDEGLGYFFGFISDFNIPMVWFADGTIFWDECYGDQHLDLTEYNEAVMIEERANKLIETFKGE